MEFQASGFILAQPWSSLAFRECAIEGKIVSHSSLTVPFCMSFCLSDKLEALEASVWSQWVTALLQVPVAR